VHIVVLAAGLGTRFGGLKQLAPVGPHGEAIMDVLLARAAQCGFDHGVVVVRAEVEESVASHFIAFPPPMPHELIVQAVPAERERPLGTAHAVLACRASVEGSFAVVNADDLYPVDAFAMLQAHLATRAEHGSVAFRLEKTVIGDQPVSRAVLVLAEDRVVEIEEHTRLERSAIPGETWVSMNMWGFQPSIFDRLEQAVDTFTSSGAETEIRLPDVVASMTASGETVRVLRSEHRCIGITYAEDLAVVRDELE